MAITGLDSLIVALKDSTKCRFYKPSLSNTAAGQIHSLWRSNGFPTLGAIPTTAAVCNDTTVGSWDLPAMGTDKLYLAKLAASSTVAGQLILFDRLCAVGGLSGTVITAQTVGLDLVIPAAQGRCGADGTGVLWVLEWYADTGATAVTATISYTNESGVAGRATTVALAATRRISTCLPILPNTSDLRIKSIETVTLSATTAAAGNFGVTAYVRHAEAPMAVANIGVVLDYAGLALDDITENSCMSLALVCTSTTTGNLLGSFEVVVG